MTAKFVIAVVVPCYRVTRHVVKVIGSIGPEVSRIYVVDDACPDGSGTLVETQVTDPRVIVIYHRTNKGVGRAMITGYQRAMADGVEVVVKIDGDGQMDPALLPRFVAPILAGEADYTKGNRFYHPDDIADMPRVRLFGNAILSILSKFSTGYWDIFDPTNGYTAVHTRVLRELRLGKVSERYFFETDMLFRLNIIRAVVMDIPMKACYGDEKSSLKIPGAALEFLLKHLRNTFKRLVYNYLVRDMSIATFELTLGAFLLLFGVSFGISSWVDSMTTGIAATSGTVMLAALPTILGIQFLLAFIGYDVQSVPRVPLAKRLRSRTELTGSLVPGDDDSWR